MSQPEKNPQKWPDVLWVVRHGESAGNVAREEAEAIGSNYVEIPHREVDVPLSLLGERQAAALGRWFGNFAEAEKPTVILTSPYKRALETAKLVLHTAALDPYELSFVIDERLREKEFGIFDRLTKTRPPGGESWCDVILRLRSVIDTLTREHRRERVLIVAHQVVVNCFRYLIERMTEEEILEMDRAQDIANCSVTSYEFDSEVGKKGKLALRLYNFVAPLEEAGEPVTTQKDISVAPK
jgi:broad specificity phosphatase PhoE